MILEYEGNESVKILRRSRFRTIKPPFQYNFSDLVYYLFCCWKPKENDDEVYPNSIEDNYRKFVKDKEKMHKFLDISEFLITIKELSNFVDEQNDNQSKLNKSPRTDKALIKRQNLRNEFREISEDEEEEEDKEDKEDEEESKKIERNSEYEDNSENIEIQKKQSDKEEFNNLSQSKPQTPNIRSSLRIELIHKVE